MNVRFYPPPPTTDDWLCEARVADIKLQIRVRPEDQAKADEERIPKIRAQLLAKFGIRTAEKVLTHGSTICREQLTLDSNGDLLVNSMRCSAVVGIHDVSIQVMPRAAKHDPPTSLGKLQILVEKAAGRI